MRRTGSCRTACVQRKRKSRSSCGNAHSTRPFQHVLEPLFLYLTVAKAQWENAELAGCYNVGPDDCDCVNTVPLSDGYNGKLTCSSRNGSVGGEMVRKMIENQERQMSGNSPEPDGIRHERSVETEYLTCLIRLKSQGGSVMLLPGFCVPFIFCSLLAAGYG